MKRWYEREEATQLRFVIVNLLNEMTGVETPETREARLMLKNN